MESIVDAELVYQPSDWRVWGYHLTMFVGAAVVLAAAMVMNLNEHGSVFIPGADNALGPSCYSRLFWGVDCPGCGLTRSFISLAHGQFERAYQFNAAGPIVFLFVLVQLPWQGYQLFRMWKKRQPFYSMLLLLPILIVNASLLIQWSWRLLLGD